MRIELSHDILAQSIYEKASSEAKLRLKIKSFVHERYKYSLENKVYLTAKDLDYINPYMDYLKRVLSAEELIFIKKSENHRLYKRFGLFGAITACGIVAFIISTAWGIRESKSKMAIEAINTQLETTLFDLTRSNEEISKKNKAIDSLFTTLGQKDNELSITAEQLIERDRLLNETTEELKKTNEKLAQTNEALNKALADIKKEKEKLEKDKISLEKERADLKNKYNTASANEASLKSANTKLIKALDLHAAGNTAQAKVETVKGAIELWKKDNSNTAVQDVLRKIYKQETGKADFSIPPMKNIVQELEKKYK